MEGVWTSGLFADLLQEARVKVWPVVAVLAAALFAMDSAALAQPEAPLSSGFADLQAPPTQWTMEEVAKDWLISPSDLAIAGEEIYVSANLDRRIAVLDLEGRIQRYYTIDTSPQHDNVCVGVTSQGLVLALSSRGMWELLPDGQTRRLPVALRSRLDHMTIGPEDGVYVSRLVGGRTIVSTVDLDGTVADLFTVDSNRVSDLDFDPQGRLFMVDAEHGRILRYTSEAGIEIVSRAWEPAGSTGPRYLAFDEAGRLYSSSNDSGLALVSEDGQLTPLDVPTTGDLVFHEGKLYALGIYVSKLFLVDVDGASARSQRTLLQGSTPTSQYLSSRGEVVVGAKDSTQGREFADYDLGDPGRIQPNDVLNNLRPSQFTYDAAGDLYLCSGQLLKKVTAAGKEEFSVELPGRFEWYTHLYYNRYDGKVYYFDQDSNRVMRASKDGVEVYHEHSSKVQRLELAFTPDGNVYASVISSAGATLLDISDPASERQVWRAPPLPDRDWFHFHIASDLQGNLYGALGPDYQRVYRFEPEAGRAVSIIPDSPSGDDLGFVDPEWITTTDSGTVVIMAPGLLVKFSPLTPS